MRGAPNLSPSNERIVHDGFEEAIVHDHQLHCTVSAVCQCCRLPNDFVFGSPYEPVVCKGCRRHVGADDEARHLRNSDHAGLYLSEIQILREGLRETRTQQRADFQIQLDALQSRLEAKNTEVAEQSALIGQLRVALRNNQVDSGLADWLADEEVASAIDEANRARRATGLVLQALSRLTVIHGRHSKRPRYCVCGKHVDQCSEYRAIESELDVLAKWEEEQFLRHKDGLEHGLCAEKVRRMELSA